tara:strand:+ start:243 stop:500 length:258 start_codon:yes stop_codon:yes gene_type:complete
MGATVMKAIPGNQGESTDNTDNKGFGMAADLFRKNNKPADTTQPMDEGKESKKKKKKKPTILTSVMGVTEDAEVSSPSLMGGSNY